MGQISVVSANLAALSIESFFYGIFFVLFCASTYFMVQRHRRSRHITSASSLSPTLALFRNPLFTAGLAMFILITAHWVLTVYGSFIAFIYQDGGAEPLLYYVDLSQPSQIGRTTIFAVVLLIADAVLLYRLWIIWHGNKYVMIFPGISYMMSVACGIAVVYLEDSGEYAFNPHVSGWITGSTVGTLCTNVSSCGLIVFKLWRANRISRSYFGASSGGIGRSLRQRAIMILIESAALYASWTIFYVAVFEAGSNLEFVVNNAWLPITGIAFTLINVRVALGHTTQPSTTQSSRSAPHWEGSAHSRIPDWRVGSSGETIAIKMETLRETDKPVTNAEILPAPVVLRAT